MVHPEDGAGPTVGEDRAHVFQMNFDLLKWEQLPRRSIHGHWINPYFLTPDLGSEVTEFPRNLPFHAHECAACL